MSNSKILRDAGISKEIVNDINNKALNHMKNTLKIGMIICIMN